MKGRVVALVDLLVQEDAVLVISEPSIGDKTRQVLTKHAIMDEVEFTPIEVPIHRVWDSIEAVWTAPPILEAHPGSPEVEIEVRRVEAGLPRYGVDVSEENFPFEAHLEPLISYTKGCYIGHEVVARAAARGHANKRLMGLRLDGEGAAAKGACVSAPQREDAGAVTSSVVSPTFGPIALAYLHKSSWEPGTRVLLGDRQARVVALPFS
jgi:folate-binding protein YgfZ